MEVTPYTNIFIKIIEKYAKLVGLEGQDLSAVIRLIIGWHYLRFECEKKEKNGEQFECIVCGINAEEEGIMQHILGEKCENFGELKSSYVLNEELIENKYERFVFGNLQKLTKFVEICDSIDIKI